MIELCEDYFDDARIFRLRACLGKGAETLPLRLFCRCGRDIEWLGPTEIERIAGWWGVPGKMLTGFMGAGLLCWRSGTYDHGMAYYWAENLPFSDGKTADFEKEKENKKEKAAKKKKIKEKEREKLVGWLV